MHVLGFRDLVETCRRGRFRHHRGDSLLAPESSAGPRRCSFGALPCNALQRSATLCNALQRRRVGVCAKLQTCNAAGHGDKLGALNGGQSICGHGEARRDQERVRRRFTECNCTGRCLDGVPNPWPLKHLPCTARRSDRAGVAGWIARDDDRPTSFYWRMAVSL
jgi:hypothetical protein